MVLDSWSPGQLMPLFLQLVYSSSVDLHSLLCDAQATLGNVEGSPRLGSFTAKSSVTSSASISNISDFSDDIWAGHLILKNSQRVCVKSLQSCLTLCDPMDCTAPATPPRLLCPWDSPGKNTGVGCHALLQGIFLSQASPALARAFFTTSTTWEAPVHVGVCINHLLRPSGKCLKCSAQNYLKACQVLCCCCLVAKLYLTVCDLMDCSPPGSSVQGILQARVLEWVAIPSSRGSSWPRDQTWVSCIAGWFFTVRASREVRWWS